MTSAAVEDKILGYNYSTTAGTVTSVTAGAGMTQSGTSTVNPTLDVVGGTGITANANDIALTNGLIADGSNITSIGTLGSLQVDNVAIDGNTMSISGGGHDFTIDGAGNISVDAVDDIIFKKAGTTSMTFKLDTTPQIDVVGTFKLDGDGEIEIESGGTSDIKLHSMGDIILDYEDGDSVIFKNSNQYDMLDISGDGGDDDVTIQLMQNDGDLIFKPVSYTHLTLPTPPYV